jgi:hypothetical protein
VRFNLSKLPIPHRCAERLWRVAASPLGTATANNYTTLTLEKSKTFSSRLCDQSGLQVASTRSEVALSYSSSSIYSDLAAHTRSRVSATLYSKFNQSVQEMALPDPDGTAPFPTASNEMALMGLYGDYVLIVPAANMASFPIDRLTDVLLRFDYLSAADDSQSQ